MLRNVIVMATSKTNSVIGHVVYTEGRTPKLEVTPYGSLVIELDESVPCITDGKIIEVKKINLSKSVIARAAHIKYADIDKYLNNMKTKARVEIKEYNKKLVAQNKPTKDVELATLAAIDACWSKIYAFSNLTIIPVAYVAGEELGAGIVAKNDGYRYDVTDIEITDAKLLSDVNPLDDELLDILGI